ncbi:MAG: shikimate dehydrogenase [Betaproteobacteria bacterium HGW-Betaproteobacteria-22]|nr:MAG: shikimate dehydrogenase [Betaproteobacteria bacterium HGW-Betaproteobacteria-22]
MTDRYAVIGNPIAHSKSPLIHSAFAAQTSQDISYERILAPLDGFAEVAQSLAEQGYQGVNVTVPFKFDAFNFCDFKTPQAMRAGAVNTLKFTNHGVYGTNTDGDGLVRDIRHNLGVDIEGKRILLLGAGGAAEGVLQPLLAQLPAALVVANRTLDKAEKMVRKCKAGEVQVATCAYTELPETYFDIVINATSTGLSETALPIPAVYAAHCLAYEMMYGRDTLFMQHARAAGASVADGLGMLVEQAAEAFFYWRGVRPATQAVMDMLRAQ